MNPRQKHQKWAYANVEEPRNPSRSLSENQGEHSQVAKEVEPKKQKVGAAGATLKHRMQSSASENCPKGGQTGQVLMCYF